MNEVPDHPIVPLRSRDARRHSELPGAKLFFLPKYSPDLNPIEMLFAKLKHGLRKAAKRTEQAIHEALELLPTLPLTDSANYFAHQDMLEARIIRR